MRGSKRPPKERAKVVGLALVKGVPKAAKATGIPMRTIRDYMKDPEFAKLRLSAREDVAEEMWATIQVGLAEVYEGLRKPGERLRDKADALFGLMNQHALYTGQATTRTETRDLTGALDDHELATLKAIVQSGHPADDPAEVAVVDSGANGTAPTE